MAVGAEEFGRYQAMPREHPRVLCQHTPGIPSSMIFSFQKRLFYFLFLSSSAETCDMILVYDNKPMKLLTTVL